METTTPTLTRERALNSMEFHYNGDGGCRLTPVGPRGGGGGPKVTRVRRNGTTQTWKTRPAEYRVPVKYGVRARDQFSIREYDANNWHAAEDCPLRNA